MSLDSTNRFASCDASGCTAIVPVALGATGDREEALSSVHGQSGWMVTEDGQTLCGYHAKAGRSRAPRH